MIKTTTLENTPKAQKNKIGFRNGKFLIAFYDQTPQREIEITPDKMEFESAYVDLNNIKGNAIKVTATLNRTPDLEAAIEEAVKEDLIPADILNKLRQNGSVHYGVVACETTQEEFMTMNIIQDGGC